ncbi:MAG: hypothetical protein IKI94_10845 [Ruminococcus sp.]|nr:hypothetical protein [Ruminococcus sp.]
MKNSKEIASAVFQARDEYIEQQQIRNKKIKKAAAVSGTACALCLTVVGAGYWNSVDKNLPVLDTDTASIANENSNSVIDNNSEVISEIKPADSIDNNIKENADVSDSAIDKIPETTQYNEDFKNTNVNNNSAIYNPDTQINQAEPDNNTEDQNSYNNTVTLIPDTETQQTEPNEENLLERTYKYIINTGKFSTYTAGKVISEDKIGCKIEKVTVTAGWKSRTDKWISTENLNAEIYEINEISNDVAVALRFLDKGEAVTTTHYYVIMNPNADLASVQDYIIPAITPNNPGDENDVCHHMKAVIIDDVGYVEYNAGAETYTPDICLGSPSDYDGNYRAFFSHIPATLYTSKENPEILIVEESECTVYLIKTKE